MKPNFFRYTIKYLCSKFHAQFLFKGGLKSHIYSRHDEKRTGPKLKYKKIFAHGHIPHKQLWYKTPKYCVQFVKRILMNAGL